MKRMLAAILVLVAGAVVTSRAMAEEVSELSTTEKKAAGTPDLLRVEVVISRYEGEKQISNAPYHFLVPADRTRRADVKMGVEVPVRVTTFPGGEGSGASPVARYQYRNVGTNISCVAHAPADGFYLLNLMVETSSVFTGREGRSGGPELVENPLFNSFLVTLDPLLRDGQRAQAVASTDPVTGDVVKIDVSLHVESDGN